MDARNSLDAVILRHAFDKFYWIDPREIVVAHWVRMKCVYGCLAMANTPAVRLMFLRWKNAGPFFRNIARAYSCTSRSGSKIRRSATPGTRK